MLMFLIFCNSNSFIQIWNRCFAKDSKKKIITPDKPSIEKDIETNEANQSSQPVVIFENSDSNPKSYINSISKKVDYTKKKLNAFLDSDYASYIILWSLTFTLVVVQIVFAHKIIQIDILDRAKNHTFVRQMCSYSETYYMFEDVAYMPFSLIFLMLLYGLLPAHRFNRYIMIKFEKYFKSNLFKRIQKENKEKVAEKKRKKEEELKKEQCGWCRLWLFKCFRQRILSCICCLCCCSCFVPPGSESRCFLCYCCCLGWKQTDVYKVSSAVLKVIKKIFYIVFLCFLWVPLWRCLMKMRAKKREKSRKKKQKGNETSRTKTKQPKSVQSKGNQVMQIY